MYGIFPRPVAEDTTLSNLNLASSSLMRWMLNLPLTSYKRRKLSPVFGMEITSIKPIGNLVSVLTTESTETCLWAAMRVTSLLVSAYFNLFLNKMINGTHSLFLCGPGLGFGAQSPASLSNIHALGALSLFKCFFGPRTYLEEKSKD